MSGNVWVKPKKKIKIWGNSDVDAIETCLENLFTNGYPVLLPSARSGLFLIFKYFLIEESVRVFPYASQCIVNAAFASGKSVCTPKQDQDRDIFYNQWGNHNLLADISDFLIEDSADSFYPIGGTVCKNGSRFEIWSLSKIIGSSNGGIVWCKNKNDALALRKIMDKLPSQNYIKESFLYLLKSKSKRIYDKWEHYQFTHPKLSRLELKYINSLITNWQHIYKQRLRLYVEFATKYCGIDERDVDESIHLNYGVVPVVIKIPNKLKTISIELHELLINGKTRKINIIPYLKNMIP